MKNLFDARCHTLAQCLSRISQHIPTRYYKRCVVLAGILAATFCASLIFQPNVHSIDVSDQSHQMTQPLMDRSRPISDDMEDYRNLLQIKSSIDSIAQTQDGHAQLEIWMKHNPGFVDSLNFLLRFYQREEVKSNAY